MKAAARLPLILTCGLLSLPQPCFGREHSTARDEVHIVSIGLLIPLKGAASKAGKAVQKALEDYLRDLPSSHSTHFRLRLIPTEERWGRQTEAIVDAVYEESTRVIIGGIEERSAHLASQIISRSKGGALLISLSPDPSLTQSGVPWVFRMAAAGPEQGPLDAAELAVEAAEVVVQAFRTGAESVEEVASFFASQPSLLSSRPQ